MIHHVDRGLAVLNSDMHMQPENQVSSSHQLHVFDNIFVTLAGRNLLRPPIGKWMRGRGRQTQAIFFGQRDHVSPQLFNFLLRLLDAAADRSPNLDHRLVHLGLHALLQQELALLNNFGMNMRSKIAGDRINCLILLFDPDSEGRTHGGLHQYKSATNKQVST